MTSHHNDLASDALTAIILAVLAIAWTGILAGAQPVLPPASDTAVGSIEWHQRRPVSACRVRDIAELIARDWQLPAAVRADVEALRDTLDPAAGRRLAGQAWKAPEDAATINQLVEDVLLLEAAERAGYSDLADYLDAEFDCPYPGPDEMERFNLTAEDLEYALARWAKYQPDCLS